MHNENDQTLAPYAVHNSTSKGRRFHEDPPNSRTEFQRDRDRIIHSTAFRRLEYKTQVFVNHEGDLFRTRLTHSMEVSQIARSVARNLQLNEDLVEAISLAHDLGHTPFGHAGQDALNDCMKDYGGFEHNLQSLRVVDELEEFYGAFDGLNLMFETREGILKHCSLNNAKRLGDVGRRFINKTRPSLEAQLTNLADAIAYNNHDIDDGLRSGFITIAQLKEVEIFAKQWHKVREVYPDISEKRATHETIRHMINVLITDLIATSSAHIAEVNPKTLDDVRNAPQLMMFSDSILKEAHELKSFLYYNLYHHYQVNRMTNKARRIVKDLFEIFYEQPDLLPPDYQLEDPHGVNKLHHARKVSDYIAGMTDRYAISEHRRIFEMRSF